MYQDELQAILQKYPEIKRIRIEKEEVLERGQFVQKPISMPAPPKMKADLFEIESPKEFPKSPAEVKADIARNKALQKTMADLRPPVIPE